MNTYIKKSKGSLALRKKLFSAAAMLLVASIMLVSTSYAWLVLSTAPEVTGITTQVGANGALEIVLLDTESYNDLTKIVEFDIDESLEGAIPAVTSSNLTWGNLVSLGDANYGLSKIALNPSRLAIERDGDSYKVNSVLLKTPVYNDDGRIIDLEEKAVSSIFDVDGKSFPVGNSATYGVRAIGVAANMSEAQIGINEARNTLATEMSKARTQASNTLNAQGNALGNVAIGVAMGNASGFAKADVIAMRDLAAGLEIAIDHIETAVRQFYLAYANGATWEDDTVRATAKSDAETKSLSELKSDTRFDAATALLPKVDDSRDIIDLIVADQETVANAVAACEAEIALERDSYDVGIVKGLMRPLVNYEQMTMGGYTMTEIQEMLAKDDLAGLAGIMEDGGVTVTVPTGSGILSDIADFADNYTAKVTVESVTIPGLPPLTNAKATMRTETAVDPVYLNQCYTIMGTAFAPEDSGSEGGTVITDYYGYAVDLAFRTNVAESNLQLQTDSIQRIYGESDNAATQGGGSYMEFSPVEGFSTEKLLKLMGGIRVVFMDEQRQVLAIAALDTSTAAAQDATPYQVKASISVAKEDGTVVDIVPSAETCIDFAEKISRDTYKNLSSTTVFDSEDEGAKCILGKDAYTDTTAGGTVRAPLYLYDFEMTKSNEHPDDPDTIYYTGGITLKNKLDSSAITALEENVPKQVTALVYLDGSIVNNSMVAANSTQSMTGTMNLQFSSSANLMPMNNQALFDGEDAAAPPEGGSGESGSESGSGSDPAGSGGDDPAGGTT